MRAYYPQELPQYTIDEIFNPVIEAWVEKLQADPKTIDTEFQSPDED